MIGNQVLMLMERELDKEFKFEEKCRELCLKMAYTMKIMAEYIKELERYPRDNVEAVETAYVLKRVQQRDMEKVTCLQIMMNQSHLGVHEKLLFVQNLKDEMLGFGLKGCLESGLWLV
ncbi:hypothetical protein Tco_0935989 [Tanacetum coccineum]